jgi:HEPN domain-containing protein
MSDLTVLITEIGDYILKNKRATDADSSAMNLPQFERVAKADYDKRVSEIGFWYYVQHGDYHYFVARTLFMHKVAEYALFAAQQCVENYLKAYLKHCNEIPQKRHRLKDLLEDCKKVTLDKSSFIHSEYIGAIVQKFDPFNEVARYPVQNTRPLNGQYLWGYPWDAYMVDYFVYYMRRTLPSIPENTWDILRAEGHHRLSSCMEEHPAFYATFKTNNINFPPAI